MVERKTKSGGLSDEVKYQAYVQFYTNLDSLIWQNIAVLITITGLGFTAIGTVIEKSITIPPFDRNQTAGMICFIVAILMWNTIFTIRRMRFHHELMESHLREIEPTGYFHSRLHSTHDQWWLAAPFWSRVVFRMIAMGAGALGVYFFWTGDVNMGKQAIDAERARTQYGIMANHEMMDNGELRFRLMGADGNGYIRTVAERGGWQKSHSHDEFKELYIVETGWMAIAVLDRASSEPTFKIYRPGQIYITNLSEIHNVYLPAKAVIHTVKFGAAALKTTWKPDEQFDLKTRNIPETEILSKAK